MDEFLALVEIQPLVLCWGSMLIGLMSVSGSSAGAGSLVSNVSVVIGTSSIVIATTAEAA